MLACGRWSLLTATWWRSLACCCAAASWPWGLRLPRTPCRWPPFRGRRPGVGGFQGCRSSPAGVRAGRGARKGCGCWCSGSSRGHRSLATTQHSQLCVAAGSQEHRGWTFRVGRALEADLCPPHTQALLRRAVALQLADRDREPPQRPEPQGASESGEQTRQPSLPVGPREGAAVSLGRGAPARPDLVLLVCVAPASCSTLDSRLVLTGRRA